MTMRVRSVPTILALTFSLTIASTANSQTPEIIDKVERELTLKRLQGTWVPDLLVTTEGAEVYPLAGRALYLTGGEFARFEGKRNAASGTFKVEEGFLRLTVTDRTPWDLEAAASQEKAQYAFKVEGDLLTLCYSAGGKGKAGDLTPGEGRQVVVYKRLRSDDQAKPAATKR
jgi:hypothetical protein